MFTKDTDGERGQVGIGTLIVFIAMVLVAAIAAGVLINTAGFLQSQAEATGQESTDLVSERIDVTNSVGIVDDANDGNLASINISVTGAAGSDDIDLNETIIQAVGPNGQENLVLQGADSSGEDSSGAPLSLEDRDPASIGDGRFAVIDESGDFVTMSEAVLNDDNDDLTIILNPNVAPFGEGSAFGEGEESTLDIVSPSGATTQVQLTAPDLFTTDGEAVRL